MNKIFLNRMYIWTFLILYMVTALISCIHAIDFFSIGNVKWMAIALAMVFEVGQAMVLSSLLLSNNRNNIMPWCLMIILTSVQVIGNVYSCFSFIAKSGTDYYQYLQKPLLFWIEGVSQETMMIIISWIIGALLPIIALCMTTMVTNNIELSDNKDSSKDSSKDETIDLQEDTLDNQGLNKIEKTDISIIEEKNEPEVIQNENKIETVSDKIKDVLQNPISHNTPGDIKINSVDDVSASIPVDINSIQRHIKNVEFKD